LNIDALEKLAKEATPGPWTILAYSAIFSETNGEHIVTKAPGFKLPLEAPKNFEYMAAFNPATTLKLIAVVKAAKVVQRSDYPLLSSETANKFLELDRALKKLEESEPK